MLTVATGELPCKGLAAGSLSYIKCADIPVIVLTDPTAKGGCVVIVPYHSLRAYTKKAQTKITWNLIGDDGYKFDTKGVSFTNAPSTFTDIGLGPQDRQYTWEVAQNAPAPTSPPTGYDHVVSVKGLNATHDLCESGDPTVINDPS